MNMETRSRASMAEMDRSLGRRLKRAREDFDWNQKELEAKSGVSRGYISKLESGAKTNPTIYVIKSLGKALGVSTKFLMGEVDDPLEGIQDDEELAEPTPLVVSEERVSYDVIEPQLLSQIQRFTALFLRLSKRDQMILLRMAETMVAADQPHIIGEEESDGDGGP